MPNLKVTENYLKEQNFQIGANTPLKKWDFPEFIVPENRLQNLLTLYATVRGTEQAFWFTDPFDYEATLKPRLTGYQSITQGIAVRCNTTSTVTHDRILFYKGYGINTGRGWKYFLRFTPRVIFGTAFLLNTAGGLVSVPATTFPFPYTNSTELETQIFFANFTRYSAYFGTPRQLVYYPCQFQFHACVRFTQPFTYRLVSESDCRYYAVSGVSWQEVNLEHPETVKAGFIEPTEVTHPGSTSVWNAQLPIHL
jgi:hypothetical protein